MIGKPVVAKSNFRDTFKGGNFLGWIPYGGGWFVSGGALRAAPNSGAFGFGTAGVKAVASETNFADFTYDAHVSVGPDGDAGLLFRVSDPTIGPDAYNGYYTGISAAGSSISLGWANNGWNPLATASIPISAGETYHIRVVAVGDAISIYVTDMTKPVLSVTDSTYAFGSIGVRHYNTNIDLTQAAFSQIAVKAV